MILGIGVDVADIRRLEAALSRTPRLKTRLFAESERGLPIPSLAGCFAAKEAVAKALGAPLGLRWTDAVVRRDARGRPGLETRGTVAAVAASLGVTAWHVSISHDAGICVAMVIAEGCGQPAVDRTDARRTDAGRTGADRTDARRTDARPTDARPTDARPTDARRAGER